SLRDTNDVTRWHLNNESGGLDFVQTGVADNRLLLSTSGNVGIGTNAPQAKLHVAGDLRADGALFASPPYLKYAEVTANVAAGASVAGTNNWRNFNTELTDTHNLGSLSGGDIILPAGTYQCHISAPGFRVETHQIRLRTSTGSNLLFGTIGYTDSSTGGSEDRSQINGQFTLAATTTVRVQHYCRLANSS